MYLEMPFKRIFCLSLLALAPQLAMAELPSIKLSVTGIDPAAGRIEATLFDSAESFLMEARLQESGDVSEEGTFEAEFVGLVEGEYAIVVVHDANDNGVFDSGFLGFGGESVGYSNDASSWLGRPGFDNAKFIVNSANQEVHISLD